MRPNDSGMDLTRRPCASTLPTVWGLRREAMTPESSVTARLQARAWVMAHLSPRGARSGQGPLLHRVPRGAPARRMSPLYLAPFAPPGHV